MAGVVSRQENTQALGMDAGERAPAQKLVAACRELAPTRGGLESRCGC